MLNILCIFTINLKINRLWKLQIKKDYIKYADLLGSSVAFLNGQEGLHGIEEDIKAKFDKLCISTLVLDNLFEQPNKIVEVVKCDTLVLFTTGFNADGIDKVFSVFEKLNYAPKNVIFVSENTAMRFLSIAKELKANNNTIFYFPDVIGDYLFEINWI